MNAEKKLKDYILSKNRSLRSFAVKSDINVMTLNNILNRGLNFASALNVYKICKGLDIDFVALMEGKIVPFVPNNYSVTRDEYDYLNKYRVLDNFGKKSVNDLIDNEFDRMTYERNSYKYIYKPFPDMPVSAGLGIDLQSDSQETLKIIKTPEAEECDFVLRVSGDSMEPKYNDGDIVLVKSQPAVDLGQVGIFIVNGEGYMKELGVGELISLNKKYVPIKIQQYDEMVTVGKVIGKAKSD